MTRSPNHRRLSLILARRASLVLGVMALGGIATGAWWARNYIYNDLAPLVETNLEQLLGRSIKLGQVEGFPSPASDLALYQYQQPLPILIQ